MAARIAGWGPRPAASAAEARAHRYMARTFRTAGLRVGVQRFRVPAVPGQPAEPTLRANVIGVLDTPRSCLRIVMAHTDSAPGAPGANDNASGLGVLAALAGRLRRLDPGCDVWLVATGAEERLYTGSPDHLGALALARRARARGGRRRLRFALSLDEVGARPALLAALPGAGAARRAWKGPSCAPRGGHACRSAGCATRAPATPTIASSSCSACPVPSSAWAPAASPAATCRATARRGSTPRSLRLARRLTEAALEAR